MLVLSRKAGERIHLGDDITLEVRRVAGNRVTLAIEAPRNVRILRGELERITQEFEVGFEPESAAQPSDYRVAHRRVNLAGMLSRGSAAREREMVG
ncbi:MAG: carbon storage regulator [Pirellulales bacterium]